jgi:hypothetical protein
MNQLPAPFVNNCQNITINYNIFQRQWILPFSDFLKLIIRLSYKWKHYKLWELVNKACAATENIYGTSNNQNIE